MKRRSSKYSADITENISVQLIRTIVARVIAKRYDHQRSVVLGVQVKGSDKLAQIGSVPVPIHKPMPEIGSLVEVLYRYRSEDGKLFQPLYRWQRPDVIAEEVTEDQFTRY